MQVQDGLQRDVYHFRFYMLSRVVALRTQLHRLIKYTLYLYKTKKSIFVELHNDVR